MEYSLHEFPDMVDTMVDLTALPEDQTQHHWALKQEDIVKTFILQMNIAAQQLGRQESE